MNPRISVYTDHLPAEVFRALARLRIAVFREWPYLYDGDEANEADYLATFGRAPDKVLVILRDGEHIVGASTGLPLARETEDIRGPWERDGFDVDRIFYFGESVLLPAYRGRGWGRRFFAERERHARTLNGMNRLTFCGVVRPEDHPLRPSGYIPLDNFWTHRGFQPTDRYCYISWRDVNQTEENAKPLRFWEKLI